MANVTWHVTSQKLTTQLSDSATGFQPIWEVHYKVDSGHAKGTSGYVEVPVDMHTADHVKAAIDAAVQNLNAVAGL